MIKPNELRLKNYVSTPAGNIYKIDAITETEVKARLLSSPMPVILNCSSLRGIPLTSEWLLKFGFKKSEPAFDNIELPYWVKKGVCLFFNSSPPENTYLIGQGYSYENIYYAARIRWIYNVHELQNIYYALTSEELTIQE